MDVTAELAECRNQIDSIDNAIVGLLAKRFTATRRVSRLKAESGSPPVDPAREQDQYARVRALAETHGVPVELATDILRAIISQVVTEHAELAQRHSGNGARSDAAFPS